MFDYYVKAAFEEEVHRLIEEIKSLMNWAIS